MEMPAFVKIHPRTCGLTKTFQAKKQERQQEKHFYGAGQSSEYRHDVRIRINVYRTLKYKLFIITLINLNCIGDMPLWQADQIGIILVIKEI
jgi:uncharacterized membrane protein YecN with MAPEG domain